MHPSTFYAREHPEDVSNRMGEGDPNYHLKCYNIAKGEAFDDLDEEQWDKYRQQAAAEYEEQLKPPTADEIFGYVSPTSLLRDINYCGSAQCDLPKAAVAALRSLCGWHRSGYGDVLLCLQGAYRNKSGNIQMFEYVQTLATKVCC